MPFPCMKAENYLDKKTSRPKYSPSGYYVTEKFDGMRAQWDPVNKCLVSRYGNVIPAPEWFLDFFSDIQKPLDGELFFGYNSWGMTGICRARSQQSHRDNEHLWKKALYLVFDTPDTDAGTYLERMSALEKCPGVGAWGDKSTAVWLIPRQKITDRVALDKYYQAVLDRGGEGVMLNNPESFYVNGRTDRILKYKPIMDDECIVVGYKPGNGRNKGRLGAFIVHPIEDGVPDPRREFSISGMTDLVRNSYKKSHPIGTILRYCCMEYTKSGKPRHPVYKGISKKPVMAKHEHDVLMDISPKAQEHVDLTKLETKSETESEAKLVSTPTTKIRAKLKKNPAAVPVPKLAPSQKLRVKLRKIPI